MYPLDNKQVTNPTVWERGTRFFGVKSQPGWGEVTFSTLTRQLTS